MKKPIYYYQDVQHFDDYNCCPRPCPPPHPCHPHHHCHPHYHGKVGIVGRTVLSVRYVDCHGHVQTFDIHENETYEIKAVSQTRGVCTFAARIIDFECSKGIEKLIDKPHMIDVTAIIVDYSDAYESKLLRIGIENIISIKPVKCFDGMIPDFVPPQCPEPVSPPHHCECNPSGYEEYVINDPFSNN